MQTLVQIYSTYRHSLRDVIAKDRWLKNFKLSVSEEKKPGRPQGWSKLHTIDKEGNGAINIEWHQSTKMLICRVVTKGAGRPNVIIGDFIDYLLACHRTKIGAITIFLK